MYVLMQQNTRKDCCYFCLIFFMCYVHVIAWWIYFNISDTFLNLIVFFQTILLDIICLKVLALRPSPIPMERIQMPE